MMNVRRIALSLVGMLFIVFNEGCNRPLLDVIKKALSSTNVVFEPNLQEPIPLSSRQAEAIRRIIERFHQNSQVQIRKDIGPSESGAFVFDDVHFGWLGSLLYLYDANAKRYYVVQYPLLGQLAEAFFKAAGYPFQNPSPEKWREILLILE